MNSRETTVRSLRDRLVKAAGAARDAKLKLHGWDGEDSEGEDDSALAGIEYDYENALYEVRQALASLDELYQQNPSQFCSVCPTIWADIKSSKCAAGLITGEDLEREYQERENAVHPDGHFVFLRALNEELYGLSYDKLLRRQEWYDRRREIIARDNSRCQDCAPERATSKVLQVHHRYYVRGWLPWNYPDAALVTLCDECHRKRHATEVIHVYDVIDGKVSLTRLRPCPRCLRRYFPSMVVH